MPPKGRKSAAATSSQQRPLSFNNRAAKVTKNSSSQDPSLASRKSSNKLSEPAQEQIVEATSIPAPKTEDEPTEIKHDVAEDEIKQEEQSQVQFTTPPRKSRIRQSTSTANSSREEEAKKVTDTQIKKYWKAEEDARLAPRVHQQSVPLHEKILRHFDLSSQYGPCIGTPRLQRWKRANALGLNPPVEVLAVLMREEAKTNGKRTCGQLAYIDELAGGRVVLVE